jgi:hypothetical protein
MIDVVRKNLKIEVPARAGLIWVLHPPAWEPCLGRIFMAAVQHQNGPRRSRIYPLDQLIPDRSRFPFMAPSRRTLTRSGDLQSRVHRLFSRGPLVTQRTSAGHEASLIEGVIVALVGKAGMPLPKPVGYLRICGSL